MSIRTVTPPQILLEIIERFRSFTNYFKARIIWKSYKDSANKGMNWHVIPLNSSHFGGLWKSAVKAAKYYMRRVLGTTTFNTEELGTIVTQIEAYLNSRPFLLMSSDPSDLELLSPGHFLIGALLTSVVEPDLLELKLNRLSRWQLVQHVVQNFWRRWSTKYLSKLQTRKKWKKTHPNIQLGAMVLLKEGAPVKMAIGKNSRDISWMRRID